MILEACVGNLQEALSAEKQGAHQIELCDRLDMDGTSPSIETVKSVCARVHIPIKVIVNPNPYHYTYSSKDVYNIKAYVEALNKWPIAGIVFGPLTIEGLPDLELLKVIHEISHLPITFHKAIDTTHDILKSTKSLLEQNIVKFILSSGGSDTALVGVNELLKMKSVLIKSQIKPIAAGKITAANLSQLHDELNFSYYHGKKIVGDLI